MNYDELISSLRSLAKKKGIDYSLDRLSPILEALDNPHLALKNCIHIAGTNGKGSTIAFLKSILIGLGFSVGTYTSPHKVSYTERISIDSKSISKDEFCHYFERCYPFHKEGLTEFETLTIMSFLYFRDKKPDYILYETGLGGRLDATNVIHPRLSIITNIDYDHQAILGHSLEAITKEKAGIMKKNVPVITSLSQTPEVLATLNSESKLKESPLIPVAPLKSLPEHSHLNANCQLINASLAKAAVKQLEFNCNEALLQRGIRNAYLWGQFEEKTFQNKQIILDGAHNPASIKSLIDTFQLRYPGIKPCIIFGIHQSKSATQIIKQLCALSDDLYYCEFDQEFATPFKEIRAISKSIKAYTLGDTLGAATHIIFTGSFYFLGKITDELLSNTFKS